MPQARWVSRRRGARARQPEALRRKAPQASVRSCLAASLLAFLLAVVALGVPALVLFLGIFWLMIAKPATCAVQSMNAPEQLPPRGLGANSRGQRHSLSLVTRDTGIRCRHWRPSSTSSLR